jgi:ABC transport system ATP-binding/permease protein
MSNNIRPVIFSAENLSLSVGEQVLLDNASLTVHEGERIGLVGRNGCGKSSFLKIVNGREKSDDGLVMYKKNLTSSYLSQEFLLNPSDTVYKCIKDGAERIEKLIKTYESLPADSNEAHLFESEITRLDGWNVDVRIKKFVNDLNIPPVDKKIDTLSGGEKRRVALARTIVSMPELLILDEPTNHLDTESIEWLESFVSSYYGTVIFVTHDRYFLDKLATRVLELSFGKFYSYTGNYSDYVIGKAKRLEVEEKLEQKRQGFLRREIDWIRSSPKARTGKSRSRIDRFDEAVNALPPEKELDVELVIPPSIRIGNKIADIKNISFSYGEKTIVNNFSYSFKHGDRIGLVGRNGAGKTTLLKLLQKELNPDSGSVELSDNVVFNYVDQGRLKLNEERTVYDEIGEGNEFVSLGKNKITIWAYLRRFLFEDSRIKTKIKFLSGGEKGRLILAKLLKLESNFIILDEPTNDLDLQTLRLLEEALAYYQGCVVLVSHDRYFMDRVCNGIISLSKDGIGEYFLGNYFYYKEKYHERIKAANKSEDKKGEVKGRKDKSFEKRKLKWKEERELETIEGDILQLEDKVTEIEDKFADPVFYEKYSTDAENMNKELEVLKLTLETMYNRWEELEELKNG